MNLKQKIEENLTLSVLGLLLVGFSAGFAAHKTITDTSGPPKADVNLQDWQSPARQAGWISAGDCPALPVSLTLASPGTGSVVAMDGYRITSRVVVQASRPVPLSNAVGVIANQEGDPNYYVLTNLSTDDSRRIYETGWMILPFKPHLDAKLNLWAFMIDDKNKLGEVYGDLSQIEAASADVVVSPKVVVGLRAE